MNEQMELVKHIYKDSEMANYTIEALLQDLEKKDNKIKNFNIQPNVTDQKVKE